MRPALLIAGKDLRLRLRDRSALITAIVAPLIIALIMSTALGGLNQGVHARLAVVDEDHGPVSAALIAALEARPLRPTLTVVVRSLRQARADIDHRSLGAIIVAPVGLSDQAQDDPPRLSVIGRHDDPVAEAIARAVGEAFTARVAAARLAVETTAAAGATLDGAEVQQVAWAAATRTANTLTDRSPGRRVSLGTYYAPAMAILFLFFTAGFGARSFLVERHEHTLQRTMAAPLRPRVVLAGKALATFVLGMATMVFLYATTTLLGDHWGSPVGVLALSAAVVASVMAVTALVVTFATTDEQALGYTSLLTFVFAIIGGNFVAVYQLPHALRAASALTPNGWAMRGFSDLAAGTGHVGTVLVPVAAMCAFALVLGTVALMRAPRLIGP